MADRVGICNLALTKLGSGSKITALTDNSPAARALNNVYDMVRKAELRAHYWAFSIKRTSIPKSSTAPSWGYSVAYPLPADFVRLMQVNDFFLDPAILDYNDADASDWALETNTDGVFSLLCNYGSPVKVRYVWDVTDEGRFDALFAVAFASRLAYEVCEQITNATSKKQTAAEDYKQTLAMAVRVGAIEKPPALIGDDSWILARL